MQCIYCRISVLSLPVETLCQSLIFSVSVNTEKRLNIALKAVEAADPNQNHRSGLEDENGNKTMGQTFPENSVVAGVRKCAILGPSS
mmetsp:Transcript_2991/g.4026  ORF Transcript_2991/g.4026 Transcript_2991/m.4026 type:complete len:87 (-) Transcript_2991:300-560(-)